MKSGGYLCSAAFGSFPAFLLSPEGSQISKAKFSVVPCLVMSPSICTGWSQIPSSYPSKAFHGPNATQASWYSLEGFICSAWSPLDYNHSSFVTFTSLQSNLQVLETFFFNLQSAHGERHRTEIGKLLNLLNKLKHEFIQLAPNQQMTEIKSRKVIFFRLY